MKKKTLYCYCPSSLYYALFLRNSQVYVSFHISHMGIEAKDDKNINLLTKHLLIFLLLVNII